MSDGVERAASNEQMPALGGERRLVTEETHDIYYVMGRQIALEKVERGYFSARLRVCGPANVVLIEGMSVLQNGREEDDLLSRDAIYKVFSELGRHFEVLSLQVFETSARNSTRSLLVALRPWGEQEASSAVTEDYE